MGMKTLDGHPCVKNKVVVTDKEGIKHEWMVWNATDLKDFPIKIVTNESNSATTLVFREMKLVAPEASLFEPTAGYFVFSNRSCSYCT